MNSNQNNQHQKDNSSSYNFNNKDFYPNNNNSFLKYNDPNPNGLIFHDPEQFNITLRKPKQNQTHTFNPNTNYSSYNNYNLPNTPESKPKKSEYDATLNSKIKKTKKRDCTPLSPDHETYSFMNHSNNENLNNSFYNNNYNINETRFSFGQSFVNGGHRDSLQNLNNISNISSILPNPNLGVGNISNLDTSFISNNYNRRQNLYLTFTQQKSKFLNDLDQKSNVVQIDSEEEKEVKNYIKGSFMLEKLENESNVNIDKIYSNLFEEKEILQKLTYEVVRSFFDGYNNRTNMFYKYIVSSFKLFLYILTSFRIKLPN